MVEVDIDLGPRIRDAVENLDAEGHGCLLVAERKVDAFADLQRVVRDLAHAGSRTSLSTIGRASSASPNCCAVCVYRASVSGVAHTDESQKL